MTRRLLLATLALSAACDSGSPSGPEYYDRVIQPILTASCVRQQGGCHKADDKGNALGNLDLTSYENVTKRMDVLRTYGSYPVPLLLLKGSGANVPPIPYQGRIDKTTVFLPSEIQHVGGATISVDSNAFYELQQWMSNGAQRDGSLKITAQQMGSGACNPDWMLVRPDIAAQVPTVDTSSQAFKDFKSTVEPFLTKSCAYGTCHSAQQSDFFLTCKADDAASAFNFLEAQQFVSSPPETSQIVLRPLSPMAGGVVHTGGVFFTDKNDMQWNQLFVWAGEVGVPAAEANLTDGQKFFRDHVMPIFLKRGCALEACHSPGSANDFKLRAGARGFFSPYSLAINYEAARRNFLVADVPDVRQSRIVKKPIVSAREGGLGLTHRGGPPLETPGSPIDPTACVQPWPGDDMAAPFCTVTEWHRIERDALITAGQADLMATGTTLPILAVTRPADGDRLIDFDTYRPGADLVQSNVTLGMLGAIDPASAGAPQSILGSCPGSTATRDVRHPAVSYDASKVAFAMRNSAAEKLDLYEVTLDATHTCKKVGDGTGHNFDPMYAPDGTLVFASSRSGTLSLKYLLPQSDLWRMAPDGAGGYKPAEQMTALLGSELAPAMMLNGQVTFTAEKASADFYQLSGRRINWDLTDYHPLLGQRATSRGMDGVFHPSVGYAQATEIREALDRNFLVVFSDVGAKGAGGTLATFNRSIGPFEADRADTTFLHAVQIVDPAATGRVSGGTQGAYRSPFPLPDGRALVSYSATTDLGGSATVQYNLVVVDLDSAARVPVANLSGGGQSVVEAVLAYKREQRPMFDNVIQLVFGGHADPTNDPMHATVHYPDLPMLGTLLGANLRTGRFVDELRPAAKVAVYQDQGPMDVATGMAGKMGTEGVYQNRKLLGTVDLASDGSARLELPSLTPLVLELQDGKGSPLFTMSEEDQLGRGEVISRGVPQKFFNSVCGGCHGSVSGIELDIAITPDALTGASVSLSRDANPSQLGP